MMKCPICTNKLIAGGPGVQRCPRAHGLLMSDKALKGAGPYLVGTDTAAPEGAGGSAGRIINCPSCSAQMMVVDYAGFGIMIDVCFSCSYRWLDAGELSKIHQRSKRLSRLKPEQLMVLEGLTSALDGPDDEPVVDPPA